MHKVRAITVKSKRGAHLEDIVTGFDICNINPLAVYRSLVHVCTTN